MNLLDKYRSPKIITDYLEKIKRIIRNDWNIMEVCGGQTHAIFQYGIDQLLPANVNLMHGPGCPVCITPPDIIDKAISISQRPNTIVCTFGDMVRVPGCLKDLLWAKTRGADIRIVYSPLDAMETAENTPDKDIVFLAVGFETTAPANAMAVAQAKQKGIDNFYLLVSQVLVPPAMEAILSSPTNRVQGFLAAGHVCTVMGYEEYEPIVDRYGVPIGARSSELEIGLLWLGGVCGIGNLFLCSPVGQTELPALWVVDELHLVPDRVDVVLVEACVLLAHADQGQRRQDLAVLHVAQKRRSDCRPFLRRRWGHQRASQQQQTPEAIARLGSHGLSP